MGIFIYLAVSKSTTKKEWSDVYGETLKLIEKFPLAERCKVSVKGIETLCLVPTKEREFTCGWHNEKVRIGWETDGDYAYMKCAESYRLPKDLVDEKTESEAGDAIYGVLPSYLHYDWEEPRCKRVYSLWGNKTQGEPYHIYLLAIACLIEDRLKEKAFIYGDITRGQCLNAVALANKYLEKKIDVPDRCDKERLYERISKLEILDNEKIELFERLYLGNQDEKFGEFIKAYFSDGVQEAYWKREFSCYEIGMIGFDKIFNRYLLWGGDLRKLCDYVKCIDKEGNALYKKFITRIMDAKLHLKVKDCRNSLEINQNAAEPYGISTLMAQFVFAGAGNKKVDRYIPIGEIKEKLNDAFGDKCDVDQIIEEYLEEELKQEENVINVENADAEALKEACKEDASGVFEQFMEKTRKKLQEEHEKYDICDYENLIFYEKGNRIHPKFIDAITESYIFYHGLTSEEKYAELMNESSMERCRWIAKNNRSILIRDIDWERIFTDIEEQKESFARYYPMVRVVLNSNQLVHLVKAIILNDDFYEYCKELSVMN